MCLNNRGIELPPKMSSGNKGKQLIIPAFSANNHFLSPGQSRFFFVILYFPLSLFCLFIVSIGAFLAPKLPFFPHSPLSHWSTTKMQDRAECEGGSGIPHAEGKHSHCQEDAHTPEQTQHLPG